MVQVLILIQRHLNTVYTATCRQDRQWQDQDLSSQDQDQDWHWQDQDHCCQDQDCQFKPKKTYLCHMSNGNITLPHERVKVDIHKTFMTEK